MRVFFMLAVIAVLGVGCRGAEPNGSERAAIEAKCDASLRQQAEQQAKTGDSTPLEVLGRADGPIDEARRGQIEKAGAAVGEVKEDLFTARIPPQNLGQVASLDFIQSLALSQTREPLNR